MPLELRIKKPKDFDFKNTVRSHGWYDLPPFYFDEVNTSLNYVFSDKKGGKHVAGSIMDCGDSIVVNLTNSAVSSSKIERDVRHILRLDDEMAEFYESVRHEPRLSWVSKIGAGRLLRSPTVFEDAVKTMCTTNCSWSLTRSMVNKLVERLGAEAAGGAKAFPTAASMAAMDEKFYRDEIRAGYRSPYFVEFAVRVAEGSLDPESWLHSELPTAELKKEIRRVKGFGDYAADNLLKLLGRYDGLALDSWLRGSFYRKHNRGKACNDKKITKFYSNFGRWQGLAIWCDMTEDWFVK